MKPFLVRWIVTTIAVLVATALFKDIHAAGLFSLLGAALLLGIVNAFLRPVLLILSAPFILLTLGLFIFVVNGLLFWMVGGLVPGFTVDGLWAGIWGAIVVSLVNWIFSAFFRDSQGKVQVLTHHSMVKQVKGRVIDEP